MAKEDPGKETPSLERPSLGFGRKRRSKDTTPGERDDTTPAAASDQDATPTTIFEADEPAPPAPVPAPEPPPPLFADEVEPVASAAAPEPQEAAVEPEPAPEPPREPRRPLVTGLAAAALTGAVVGLVIVALTAASFRLCEVVKGTSSCGGPGVLLLIAIMAATVFLGAAMLRLFHVVDPGSTSFLAVGLTCVLSLLFLIDVIFDWWMIIAIPVISIGTFALSHWVTTRLIEPADH
jgi:hypothetical protein